MTAGDGVFQSIDGGTNWVGLSSGLVGAFIQAVAIDPVNSDTVYAATFQAGLRKTTDGAREWTSANSGLPVNTFSQSPDIQSIAVDPTNPTTLYVTARDPETFRDLVFMSTDGGQGWVPANSGLENAFNIGSPAFDPSNPSILYLSTGGGVFKSTDGGQSWVPANSGLENTFNIGSLAIDPSNPSTLYAGTGIGAFKSTDGGQSWAGLSGLMDLWVDMLVINPNNPATLYAATTTGLFKSTNGGESWNPANSDIPLAPTQEEFAEALSIVNALDLDPANAGTLYAGTLSGGVFKSTNSGRSWVEFNSGLPSMLSIPDRTTLPVVRLAVDPSNPSTIYLGTFGSGVFKSTDSASTWQPAGPTGNESTLYFAQFGNGTGLTSDIVLSNPSSTQTVMGTATFSSSDGSGFEVGLEGSSASSSVDLQVPPLGSTTISTDGQGDLAVGSAAVTSDNVLGGVVRFDISGIGIAGVGSSIPHSGFLVPVRRQAGGINTGIAMHNTGSQVVTLNLTLRNPQGEEVTGGTKTIVDFPAAGHLAQFINELFPDADTDEFEGVLVVEVTEGSVAATALEFGVNAGQFTTLPVTSTTGISASSQKLYFADFANGVGLISEMVLANPSATDTVSGQVDFFDGNGFPLTVSLTSGEASSVGFEIPASGVTKIASDGQGNLTIGSAVVNSEGTLGGVVRFNISAIGIAGVGASQPLSGFVTPVRRQAGGINTGVAIYNTESQPATLTLTLRDQDGTSIPNGTRSIQDFPAGGQLAQFIGGGGEVLLPDANMDDFEGTLVVEVTGGTIAAIALELGTQPGQFTTLPVTPLE